MTWFGRPTRKACKSRPSLTPPLRRVGASSVSLSALHRVHCLAVRRRILEAAASSSSRLLTCARPHLQPVSFRPRLGRRSLLLQLRGLPVFRPSRAFRMCLRRRLSSILRLGSDSVRGILAAMVLACAAPTASSVIANVIIPPAQLSVRGRTTL